MLWFAVLLVLTCSWAAVAETPGPNGYVLVGAGAGPAGKFYSHAAAGGEVYTRGPFGVGGEFGLIAGHDSFAPFSINAYYHVPVQAANGKLDPFVTGGYTAGLTIALAGSAYQMGNVGGGMTYWFRDRLGLRTEFRSFVRSSAAFSLFRVGISFR